MRILSRYIFREILTSSVLGTLLVTFIVFLRQADQLFEILATSTSTSFHTVLSLFGWAIPPILPLTIPFGVLVGILIGLGRLSSDGEITAMRAAGVPSQRVIAPVLFFATLGMGLAAYASLRLSPLAVSRMTDIENQLAATQLSAAIEPRVFDENFPNHILYVGDARGSGTMAVWRPVFIADITPPAQRAVGLKDKADGPIVTVAQQAIAVPDPKHNRIQLTMTHSSTHEMSKDGLANDESSDHSQQVLDASPPEQKALNSLAMSTRALAGYHGPDWLQDKIELHRRFALPVACFVLAMVGIPLGATTRKGGKSAAYVNAIFLAFFCYYLFFLNMVHFAQQRALPAQIALWLPDAVFGIAGLIFLLRMEMPGDTDILTKLQRLWAAILDKLRFKPAAPLGEPRAAWTWRLPLLPQIVDTYLLSSFLFYLMLWLAGFVSLTLIYNFFELMSDMVKNHIPFVEMLEYLFFLTPMLIYETLPVSILVAVLVTLGVLSKQNEITAFKASGVSLYRLAGPILLGSFLLSGSLFAFDYYYVPSANIQQEKLRDKIKGRAQQSWERADRKWIMGQGSRIYYYRYFDATEKVMFGVNVFELDPTTFQLRHEVVAERARWSPHLKTWIFESGWSAQFQGNHCSSYTSFQASPFRGLTEPPDWFLREVLPDKQLNFRQLESYIGDLAQSGANTVKLQVQFYRKFSVPLFALIMSMIAAPFGFMVGNRGAMTGIGVSIAIAIVYLGVGKLFEKLGDVSLLPPPMAAWAPDVVFGLAGAYFLMRMRT